MANLLAARCGVKVEHPQSLWNLVREYILRILGLLADNLKWFTILGNLYLPVICPVPDVNHNLVAELILTVVCALWEVVKEYTHLTRCAVEVAHSIHIKAAELRVGREFCRLEVPLDVAVSNLENLTACRLARNGNLRATKG